MEHTAVQWLIDWMGKNQYFIGNDLLEVVKQAKEMEKEQIENAYNQGASDAFDKDYLENFLKFNDSEDYYNKMYNQLNNK